MASSKVMHSSSSTNPNNLPATVDVSDCGNSPIIRPKTVADLWREIVGGGNIENNECKIETAVAAEEEETIILAAETEEMCELEDLELEAEVAAVIGNGNDGGKGVDVSVSETVLGEGTMKRSRVVMEPLDNVCKKRHTRMMKNREAANRSRARKQTHRAKERYKQFTEKVVPVGENRKPSRTLRRVNSM